MSLTDKAQGLSPEVRAALFHFTMFGAAGVSSVYFAIWLSNRGISPDEIGIINAAPVILILAINLFVGRLADKASDWKQAIVILALIGGIVPIGLFFVSGFWGILLVWTLCIVPYLSMTPLIDAATLRMTQRNGTDFAAVRAWGTIGYLIATLAAGPLIAVFGDAAFVPLFVAGALLRALISLQLPRFRAVQADAPAAPVTLTAKTLGQVMKPWFLLTLVGLGMHISTNGVFVAFAALVWQDQGISADLIGPLFAVMAAAEAAMMFFWTRLGWTLSARHMIIFSAFVAAVRWSAMAFSPPVWVLFILQTLHAVTFGFAYFGGMHFIANWTSEEIAAEAQSFAAVVQQAVSIIALVGFGWCAVVLGPNAWLALAGFALAGAGLVYVSLWLKPAHH